VTATATALLIYEATTLIDVVACNEKSRTKSLEQAELWIVDPRTGRVLPYREGGVAFAPFRDRGGWWEVVLSEVEPEGGHVASPSDTADPTPVTVTASGDAPQRGASLSGEEAGAVRAGGGVAGGGAAGGSDGTESAVRMGEVLRSLGEVIAERHRTMPEGSYTTHLFTKGASKIRKKTGEEAVELILATDRDELRSEAADLIYHLMVLLESEGMRIEDVVAELAGR
jgi:phosphoribosyl-ATP pyrophosphohydrolase/phosphoribosyl-AMP cyclohydrolase